MIMACKYPITVRNPKFRINPTALQYLKVPCGKCVACKQRRSRQWIFRLKQENKLSENSYFVTLTYDDHNLVYSDSGVPTLCKPDFQRYIKRLRRAQEKKNPALKLKYFACGEYGSRTFRPHYHALLFNVIPELIEKCWSIDGEPIGLVHIGTVTEDSIAYNTKYIMKAICEYQDQFIDDRSFQREFALMSKGIGKGYSDNESIKRYHNKIMENCVRDEKGFITPMPRYYKDKLFNDEKREELRKKTVFEAKKLDVEEFWKEIEADKAGGKPYKHKVQKQQYEDYIFNKRLNNKQSKF